MNGDLELAGFALAIFAIWMLWEIRRLLKALHHMELQRYKRERPELFDTE